MFSRFNFAAVPMLAFAVAMPAVAAQSPFDLPGPALTLSVTHQGATLPIAQVPNLAAGDTISIVPDLPDDQSARYVLIAAFLRGATNPPPKEWFHEAETWKKKARDNSLTLKVPQGARQLVLFLMPKDHGDFDAVVSTVRKQPGTFVRASQELNQASLDRARLDTFVARLHDLERDHPERIATTSPTLTRSLSIKLNADCLAQAPESQAACLTQDRESLLLADSHSSALAETLAGAPTDLAFQISSTAKAGYGYYSPYIGMVRDLARIFGAFQTTQLQYIPAITRQDRDRMALLLNAAPSFGKPASVLVVAMPSIEPVQPPPLRRAGDADAFCSLTDPLALPVEGAPLIYATDYAHDMALRVPAGTGKTIDVPVSADPDRGGYVVDAQQLKAAGIDGNVDARLHGRWGFAAFDGPAFRIEAPRAGSWALADADTSVVIGRDNDLALAGAAPSCVSSVTLRASNDAPMPVKWQAAGAGRINVTLPLAKAQPGPMTLQIASTGSTTPDTVSIKAVSQGARIDGIDFHAGDGEIALTGTRLDAVASVTLADREFTPVSLNRSGDSDHLLLGASHPASAAALAAGANLPGIVRFTDGRSKAIHVTVAPARPTIGVLQLSVDRSPTKAGLPIRFSGTGVLTPGDRLTFSFRSLGAPLDGSETIEIATADGHSIGKIDAEHGYSIQSTRVGIVSVDPASLLGTAAYGGLRFRVVTADGATQWASLATLVRVPEIDGITCEATGCTLRGNRLYLLQAVAAAADFRDAVSVADGFVGAELVVPRPPDGLLHMRLRDDPSVTASITAG